MTTIGKSNISGIRLDVSDRRKLTHTLKKFDLVVGALPGRLGYRLVKTCIGVGVDGVDVSYMPENPLTLHRDAVKAGVTIIPDCGLAPGLSNLLVGRAVSQLDEIEYVHIAVGGLPVKRTPPLDHVMTWCVEDFIDEYARKVRIVERGKVVEVEALSGLEEVDLPGIGKLEAFYTDGLRTLLHTIRAESMWEKTLRYPGHAKKMKLLKELGFFDEKPLKVDDVRLPPRRLTARLLDKKLRRPGLGDVVALNVDVGGRRRGTKIRHFYRLIDRYDKERGITAMARTTAYTASVIAQLVAGKFVREDGVIPLEKLGMKPMIFDRIMAELEERGIKIRQISLPPNL
jgi:saccharopine dehydrogenase-like NADP-dependent oxidoreductase